MKVSELINQLISLPADTEVVVRDNEWGDLEPVHDAILRVVDIAVTIRNTPTPVSFTFREGESSKLRRKLYRKVIRKENRVELLVGRLA